MNEKTKESKFLDAINRYADHRKALITQEIESYKSEKIEQATEKGLQDAYDLIRDDIANRKAKIVNRIASQELQLRNELFAERQAVCDKVFARAEDQLRAFTKSADYTAFLQRSLDEIAQTAGGEHLIISIAPADADKRTMIERSLPDAEIKTDSTIMIGGISSYCPAKGIRMDDTLDTRLREQYAWFIENSGLKVV